MTLIARRIKDLYLLFISLADAALGNDAVVVPTVNGKAKIRVQAGTDSGTVLRLRSKGMPRLRAGGRGDMLITIHVETPKHITRRAKDLLEELRKELK